MSLHEASETELENPMAERAQAVVQHVETAQPPTVMDETAALISMIERCAMNPAADIDKMERLLAMQERVVQRRAEHAFNEAMNQAQAELRPISADSDNPQTKSRYASFSALDHAVRPIYARHGFSLSFDTGDAPSPDHLRLICHVGHSGGHTRTYRVDMPADGKGAKGGDVMTKTHATGAAMSYGQRYLLKLIFNLAVGDDVDGNAPPSAREQSAAATAAISAINLCTDLAELKVWKAANAAGLQALPTAEADEIVRLFNSRYRKLKGDDQ